MKLSLFYLHILPNSPSTRIYSGLSARHLLQHCQDGREGLLRRGDDARRPHVALRLDGVSQLHSEGVLDALRVGPVHTVARRHICPSWRVRIIP